MKRYLYLIFLLFTLNVSAINHMDMITTITGDFPGARMGYNLASLDFNGDGIKDLAVLERNWNPSGVGDGSQLYGRIYFYWGGTNFDNIPGFTISGSADLLFGHNGEIINAGDVNNDGYEDLAVTAKEGTNQKLMIFYGRQSPINVPDVVMLFPISLYGGVMKWLGDINADGFDDIGLSMSAYNTHHRLVKIILGGSYNLISIYDVSTFITFMLNGIGDVNDDGIADYLVKYPLDQTDETQNRLSLHFGSSSFPDLDSLVICPNTNTYINPYSAALGDVNGDGMDDFASFIYADAKVWFGSHNLSTQWDVVLNESSFAESGEVLCHGDFNNDGYEDILGGGSGYDYNTGIAYIWLGRSNFNGTVDLSIPAQPGVFENFGFARVAGDFNNDGFCDVAISQPYSTGAPLATPGHVYVYAGNAELEDTTVANEDNTIPTPDNILWDITIYPNPLPTGKLALSINFTGDGYSKSTSNLKLTVYNIKGQKLDSYKISGKDIAKKSWKGILKSQLAGEYLISISDKNTRLITKSITIQ